MEKLDQIWTAWEATHHLSHQKAKPGRLLLKRYGLTANSPPDLIRFRSRQPFFEKGRRVGTWPALLVMLQDRSGAARSILEVFTVWHEKQEPAPRPLGLMLPIPEAARQEVAEVLAKRLGRCGSGQLVQTRYGLLPGGDVVGWLDMINSGSSNLYSCSP
ncbi:MAG: hypothetical protein HQL53_06190 [Magnetococcales bacterium]|nr:hypothetical protein [Magnetococcales bacterium]